MTIKNTFNLIFIVVLLFALTSSSSYGATVDELKAKIDATSQSKATLEAEIAKYQAELKGLEKQTQNLQTTIKTLEATEKKINADIKLTQNKILATELRIEELEIGIHGKQVSIDKSSNAIAETIRNINDEDNKSIIENLLHYNELSELWDRIESSYKFQESVRRNLDQSKIAKEDLETNKSEAEKSKKQLLSLKSELNDQKQVLQISKNEKNKILKETQNKESNYKKVLAEKEALKLAFERELSQFESELKFALDPSSIPRSGSGVLSWPLDTVYITQKFGVTADSGRLYTSGSHNGVDFRASVGTRVKSALSGTVVGTGDTDLVCPAASYGKWVLVRHDNGLSTLYGHLSLVKVSTGQAVSTGEVLGYSGNTGYSTGPHLHFTVFASEGVKIASKKSAVCKGTYTMPLAGNEAYLDPLLYL